MKLQHPKILALQQRSKIGVNYSGFDDFNVMSNHTRALNRTLEDGEFAAYFCVWDVVDSYGTMWQRGAFAKSIKERGPKSKANQKIAIVWQHDIKDPIAQPVEIVEDEFGAYVVGKWEDFDAVPNAKRAASQIVSGAINGFSFGFDYLYDKMEYVENVDAVRIVEAVLYEISPVTFASIKQTFAIRSEDDYNIQRATMEDTLNEFIHTIPKGKQLELRTLISNFQTLIESKPVKPLVEDEPNNEKILEAAGYSIDLNKL
jgi:HK97 family phage prohead protease